MLLHLIVFGDLLLLDVSRLIVLAAGRLVSSSRLIAIRLCYMRVFVKL